MFESIKASGQLAKILSKGKDVGLFVGIFAAILACIPILCIVGYAFSTLWWFCVFNWVLNPAFGVASISWLQALGIALLQSALIFTFKSVNTQTNTNSKD